MSAPPRPAPLSLPAHIAQHRSAAAGACAEALATEVAARLGAAVAARGQASLAVSGGRTPVPFFEALARAPLRWSRIAVTLVDDRWVPEDHADSNAGLLRRHLLQGPAEAARFLPLVDAASTPEGHRAVAEQTLAELAWPLDVVVLGMGDDAHTASIFPGAPGAAEALDRARPARLVAVTPLHAPHRRISFSLRALLDARWIAVHLAGAGKAAVIEQAVAGPPAQYPIAAVLAQREVPLALYWSP